MSLQELLALLADPAKLGAISFFVVALLKKMWPAIEDDIAWVVSILAAVVVSAVARELLPYAGKLPAEIVAIWPLLVWAGSQLWYKLVKWLGLATEAVRARM